MMKEDQRRDSFSWLLIVAFVFLSMEQLCSASVTTSSHLSRPNRPPRPYWPPSVTTDKETFRKLWTCPCSNLSLCEALKTPPVATKEVLAFSTSNSSVDWEGYDWKLLTTVALFDVGSVGTNEFPPPLVEADPRLSQLGLLCLAHAHDVKTVFGVAFPVEHLGDEKLRIKWILSWLEFVNETFTDGVNIDFESPILANDTSTRENLNLLVSDTAAAFRSILPNAQITFDVAWSPNCIDERCFDYSTIANVTDFSLVMSYDLQSQIPLNRCIAGPNAALPSVSAGLESFLALGIPASKLVLGVPWYGHDYPCLSNSTTTIDGCYLTPAPFRGAPCSDAMAAEVPYSSIVKHHLLFSNGSVAGQQWDPTSSSPWLNYWVHSGNTSVLHQLWYDDAESLGAKYALAQSMGLRGVGVWQVDALDYTNQTQVDLMWGTLGQYF